MGVRLCQLYPLSLCRAGAGLMLKTLLLICAASLPHSECTPETARAVIQAPEQVICTGMAPQALLASTRLRAGDDEYVLIRCRRDEA